MRRFVLDASISLAWFVDDPVPELAIKVERDLENNGTALVPALWHLEMANGIALAHRRGAMTKAEVDLCLDRLEALLATVIESSSTLITLRHAQSTAHIFSLTAYDAVYLETARREGLPLATLDRALAKAASQAGVHLLR